MAATGRTGDAVCDGGISSRIVVSRPTSRLLPLVFCYAGSAMAARAGLVMAVGRVVSPMCRRVAV